MRQKSTWWQGLFINYSLIELHFRLFIISVFVSTGYLSKRRLRSRSWEFCDLRIFCPRRKEFFDVQAPSTPNRGFTSHPTADIDIGQDRTCNHRRNASNWLSHWGLLMCKWLLHRRHQSDVKTNRDDADRSIGSSEYKGHHSRQI